MDQHSCFVKKLQEEKLLSDYNGKDNAEALDFVQTFYNSVKYNQQSILNCENNSDFTVISEINGESYLIPPKCRFFNNDIKNIGKLLEENEKFDFIVLDPPWWNKYIRRAKSVNKDQR